MRGRNWQKWEFIGLLVTIAAGNLLHFVYDWTGGSPIAAVFSAVNESVWEHMKLLAVPWILWTVVQAIAVGRGNVLSARTAGLLSGLAAIPVLYYTYTGALGRNISLVNILIFQLAVLLAYGVSFSLQKRRRLDSLAWQAGAVLVLLVLAALFLWWTFAPPPLPLFIDPSTGLAGRPN